MSQRSEIFNWLPKTLHRATIKENIWSIITWILIENNKFLLTIQNEAFFRPEKKKIENENCFCFLSNFLQKRNTSQMWKTEKKLPKKSTKEKFNQIQNSNCFAPVREKIVEKMSSHSS